MEVPACVCSMFVYSFCMFFRSSHWFYLKCAIGVNDEIFVWIWMRTKKKKRMRNWNDGHSIQWPSIYLSFLHISRVCYSSWKRRRWKLPRRRVRKKRNYWIIATALLDDFKRPAAATVFFLFPFLCQKYDTLLSYTLIKCWVVFHRKDPPLNRIAFVAF